MTSIIPINDDDRSALYNLSAALRPLRNLANELEITLTLPLVETLLAVAIHPDKTIGELAKAAGVRNGTMGRCLSDLTDINRSGSPGLGLVNQQKYPYDNRHTRNRLSVKGRTLVQKIAGVMDLWCQGNLRVAA